MTGRGRDDAFGIAGLLNDRRFLLLPPGLSA
jgi:hypothetical protein